RDWSSDVCSSDLDRHRLAGFDRIGQAGRRRLHVAEQGRVGHEAAQGRKPLALDTVAGNPSREQQLGDEVIGGKTLAPPIGARATPLPRLTDARAVDAESTAACGLVHARVPAARIRARSACAAASGIAGISWLPSELPPGTPKTSVASPRGRRMKSVLRSMLCTEA